MRETKKSLQRELSIALHGLNESRKVNKDGKVSYVGFGFKIWRGILLSRLDFDSAIPQTQKKMIISKIMFKPRAKNKITIDDVVKEVSELEKKYLESERAEFHMLAHLQLEDIFPFKSLTINDVQMTFSPSIRKYDRTTMEEKFRYIKFEEPDYQFKPVILKTKARCNFEAMDKCLETLDIFRGALNMIINFGAITWFEAHSEIMPLHKVPLGPLRTLHHPNGRVASQSFYLESEFRNLAHTQNLSRYMRGIKRLPHFLRKITKISKVSSHACESIIRYIKALDHKDYGSAYLHLWSTLEYLTNTYRYELTVRRAASIFEDYDKSLYILESFKNVRNRFVHKHKTEDITIVAVSLLKRFVEHHILNLIHNPYDVKTIEEYGHILDLLKTKSQIRKSSLVKMVLRKKRPLDI